MSIRYRVLSLIAAIALVLLGLLPMAILEWRWEIAPSIAQRMDQPIGMHPVQGILFLAAFMLSMFLPLGPAWFFLRRTVEGTKLPSGRTMLAYSLGGYVAYAACATTFIFGLYGLQQLNG